MRSLPCHGPRQHPNPRAKRLITRRGLLVCSRLSRTTQLALKGIKPMLRRVFLTSIAQCLFVGCVAQQRQQAVQSYAMCLSAVYASPQTAPLRAHIPFDSNDATLAQLADTSFATETEISSLEAVYPQLKSCENEFLRQLMALAPPFAPIFAANYRATDDDVVALVQHKMTWSDFTRRRRDRDIETGEAVTAEKQRLAAEHQVRTAAMLQGLAILLNQAQPSSLPAGAYRIPNEGVTCTQMGAFTRCW